MIKDMFRKISEQVAPVDNKRLGTGGRQKLGERGAVKGRRAETPGEKGWTLIR